MRPYLKKMREGDSEQNFKRQQAHFSSKEVMIGCKILVTTLVGGARCLEISLKWTEITLNIKTCVGRCVHCKYSQLIPRVRDTGTTFALPHSSCYLAKDPIASSEMCISFRPIPLNSFNELYLVHLCQQLQCVSVWTVNKYNYRCWNQVVA